VDTPKRFLRQQEVRLRRRVSKPKRIRLRLLTPLLVVTALPVALLRSPGEGQIPEIPSASAATPPIAPPTPAPVIPRPSPPPPPTPVARAPKPPATKIIAGTLGEGSSLLGALQAANLSREALFELLDAAGKVIDFRRCRSGDRYRLLLAPDGRPQRLEFFGAGPEVLGAQRKATKLVPFREPLRGERDTRVLRGTLSSSLEGAVTGAGGTARLAANLADLFAWDLDFNVDPRVGDTFAIAVERVQLPDGSWREGEIAGAEYRGAAGRFRAFRFHTDAGDGYFDEQGRPLQRRYLASPLPFVRITSRFGRRTDPILSRIGHHGGIDYAAPTGTPAWAVADGRVEFAGRKGGFGNLVILRHPDGNSTYYAHLSRIGAGISRGARVRQKEVVGLVGSTGRSTGPHLHFALRQEGRFVDPARSRGKRAAPLPAKYAPAFRRRVEDLGARLARVRVASAR
jgi:murein DD-endopeptidase MepM/ murein hydrolase activator NlpD